MKQNFNNLPAEIRDSSRFFLVAENKRPLQKDWSNPAVQRPYTEINGLAGFDTVGHGVGVDFLLADFDHVLNAEGNFVNEAVADLFGKLTLKFSNIYVEKSISGAGLHVFLKPSPNKFNSISNCKLGVYHFSSSRDKDAPKLELFYGSGGRYCLVTGNLFNCTAPAVIPEGVEVDDYLTNLLADIQAQLKTDSSKINPARNAENIFDNEETQDPPEYTQDLISAMLEAIDPAALNDTDWLAVISACKNLGVSYSTVDSFNRRDSARYSAEENQARWDSLNDSAFGIEVLIGKAQDNGFDFKEFKRQWFKEHSQYQKARFEGEEAKLAADVKTFEEEKKAAIEYLKNLETFDRNTVTSEETLKAASFAKLFDTQAFSKFKADLKSYGVEHPKEKVTLPDLTAAMKDFITEIDTRKQNLTRRGNVLIASKDTANFFAKNDFLNNFNCPPNYSISAVGVFEQRDNKFYQICYSPIIISDKYYNLDTQKYSLRLAFKQAKKWRYSPVINPAIVADTHKLTILAENDLPVSTANAFDLVKFFDAFKAVNAENIPVTCLVNNCGWRKINGKLEFIDPRRNVSIVGDNEVPIPVKPVETSFTKALKSVGNLEQWKEIYDKVKNYPVARAIVAAAVASPLLKVVKERNFVFYIWADTTAGKTAALKFAASAVGDVAEIVKVLNATANSVTGVAANYDDYFVCYDEKEEADDRLRDNLKAVVYRIANGVDKGRMNKDLTIREQRIWQNITAITGETPLLDDNVTGGALRRVLSVAAPSPVIPADICKQIYDTIDHHYGLLLPRVIEIIYSQGFNSLRDMFNDLCNAFKEKFQQAIVFEHCRYIAILTLGDYLLNVALEIEDKAAYADAVTNMIKLFEYIPTKADISDSRRFRDLVLGFIAQNQRFFIGALNIKAEEMLKFFGKFTDDGAFITNEALKQACNEGKIDYKKLVQVLRADGFFIPNDKGKYGANERIGSISPRCHKINPKYLPHIKDAQ